MLFMIGMGLGDENDVTAKGDAAIRSSSLVVLEMYTSILGVNTERLAEKYGKEIVIADREMVESEADKILEPAREGNVAFLVVGDVMAATTHTDLALRALDMGIEVRVIHNASIMNAVASCGLQLYNFGQTITVPFWTDKWQPDSFFEKILHNSRGGLHTLCLLDIKVKEPDFQAMARGKRKFLPPRYMTVRQAAAILLEIGKRRREEGVDTTVTTLSGSTLRVCEPTSLAVAVCRIGMATQLITSGTLEQLARSDCGPPLHSLVLVGETHELEDALLARMAIDAEPGKGPRPAPGDAVGELPPPARATLLEPEDIEVWDIPAAGDPRPGGETSIGAAVVGVPAAAAAATSADAASS
ncbi:hypothetical protein FNF27_01010 [Cafeteria roenbergensis]|uniref:diphthine methyl ester synthase n=1 Tax=Cafeteria roenbergensis TaxID=33653 RepID=A0A5A8EJQ5_CAFRO|nr:hypothetical protein FNF27_01010 [Cafeteria roenbergensis]|mmetsp:Transcript_14810/g.55815  ORF Transcript_14810/g.55815 Transcript_14810/m.55815 type:complete len:357 (-) Transcript_14810:52-1122(-)